MKIRVKFKALTHRGKIVHKIIMYDCPEFTEESGTFEVNGDTIPYTTTVASQVCDWLDNQDKLQLMDDNDWGIIIDYHIHNKQKSADAKQEALTVISNNKLEVGILVNKYLSDLERADQLKLDFIAVYQQMYEVVKEFNPIKQFKIVLEALGVGYQTSSEAYRHMNELLSGGLEKVDEEKLISAREKFEQKKLQ